MSQCLQGRLAEPGPRTRLELLPGPPVIRRLRSGGAGGERGPRPARPLLQSCRWAALDAGPAHCPPCSQSVGGCPPPPVWASERPIEPSRPGPIGCLRAASLTQRGVLCHSTRRMPFRSACLFAPVHSPPPEGFAGQVLRAGCRPIAEEVSRGAVVQRLPSPSFAFSVSHPHRVFFSRPGAARVLASACRRPPGFGAPAPKMRTRGLGARTLAVGCPD